MGSLRVRHKVMLRLGNHKNDDWPRFKRTHTTQEYDNERYVSEESLELTYEHPVLSSSTDRTTSH